MIINQKLGQSDLVFWVYRSS